MRTAVLYALLGVSLQLFVFVSVVLLCMLYVQSLDPTSSLFALTTVFYFNIDALLVSNFLAGCQHLHMSCVVLAMAHTFNFVVFCRMRPVARLRPFVVSLGTLNLALFFSHSSTELAVFACYSHLSGAFTLRQFRTVVSAHGCDGDHLLCRVSRVFTLHHFVGCVAISETLPL